MAVLMPHSRHRRMHQSANMLDDCCCCVRWRWECGTMATAVNHLGHDVLADVVGLLLLWVVSYIVNT
jgi:hypothetical protein